ncbi:lytic transglycosylase domain-containing protein [Vibrio sp. WXL103]|uniref:lytic transglycosylase domain-containing protein n=1 Tax=unclassified Vibrio TaxID=2614977 RepID=UPI003EC6E9A1
MHRLLWLMILLSHGGLASGIQNGGRDYQSAWKSSYQRTSPASKSCPRYCEEISYYSAVYGVPKPLLVAIIRHESNFNPYAVSPKGAKGLMQLMDANSQAANIDPFDPTENIQAGTALFARLLRRFNDVELALAAYNAGEGNVKRYDGIPPFPETRTYITRIMAEYQPR